MQTSVHLKKTATAVAECTDSYTSVDLYEDTKNLGSPDVVVFVDAASALALAREALAAYSHLSGNDAHICAPASNA